MVEQRDGLLLGTAVAVCSWFAAPLALGEDTLQLLGRAPSMAPQGDGFLARAIPAVVELLCSLGFPPLHALLAISALCVAVATVLVHGVARSIGAGRGLAIRTALLVVGCPAVSMAGTTAGAHAAELLLAAAVASIAARWLHRATPSRGILLVVSCGIAGLASPILVFAPVVALCQIAVMPRVEGEPKPASTAGLLVAALIVDLLARRLWLEGGALDGLPRMAEIGAYDLRTLWPLVHKDALRAGLPLSFLLCATLASSRHHRATLVVLTGAAAHVLLGCHRTDGIGGEGWFLLPLVAPSALLVARWLTPKACWIAIAIGFVLSGTKLALNLAEDRSDAFVDGLREVAGERSVFLLSGPQHDEAIVLARPPKLDAHPVTQATLPGADAATDALRGAILRALQDGRVVLLTVEAESALRDPSFRARHPLAPRLLAALEADFAWRPVVEGGFQAQELRLR